MKNKYKVMSAAILIILLSGCSNDDNTAKVRASGNIEAIDVTVSSRITGEVLRILREEGDQVSEGDTILIIDNELLQYQLDQALAVMEVNEAQLSLLEKGARDEDIKQAEEALKQAKINYELASNDRQRMANLYESRTITKKQLEDAQARADITAAQWKAAQENLKKLENFVRPEELKQAAANLKRRQAAVDLLKMNIRDSYVTAPISGIITEKYVEKGETVANFGALFRLANLEVVNLIIYVPETELAKIKPGDKADVTIDSYSDKTYEGAVVYISPEAEFTPKNIQTKDERTKLVFAVKVRIENPQFELKAGMPADAVIHLK